MSGEGTSQFYSTMKTNHNDSKTIAECQSIISGFDVPDGSRLDKRNHATITDNRSCIELSWHIRAAPQRIRLKGTDYRTGLKPSQSVHQVTAPFLQSTLRQFSIFPSKLSLSVLGHMLIPVVLHNTH